MKKNACFFIAIVFLQLFPGFRSFAQNCSINAGTNYRICLGSTINLNGSLGGSANTATIQWTLVSQPAGAGTLIANTNSLSTNAGVPAVAGVYVFKLSAMCGDNIATQDTLTINVDPLPGSPVQSGTSTFTCYPDTAISLSGTAPASGESVTWETVGGNLGSFSSPTAASTKFTPLFPPDECSNTSFEINIKYTITNASGCKSSVTRTYSFSRSYTLRAIADPSPACGTSTFLKGSCPGTGTALWTTVSKPSTAPNPVFSTASSRNTVVSGLVAGNYTFRYTITGGCNAGFTDVNVTMTGGSGITDAHAGADQYFCTAPGTISLSGNTPAVGETVSWTKLSGGPVSFGAPSNANTTVSGLTNAGAPYYFLYTIVSAGGCSSNDTVAVYVYPALTLNNNGYTVCSRFAATQSGGNVTFGAYGYKQVDTVQASITYLSGPYAFVDAGWTVMNGTAKNYIPANILLGQTRTVTLAGDTGAYPLYIPGLANPASGLYSIDNYFYMYAAGTYKFHVSYITKCGTYETDVTTTRGYEPVTGVNAGTDVYLPCNATTATLAGSIPLGTGENFSTWKTIQMPVGATNPIDSSNQMLRNPPLTGLINGTYIFRYSNNPGPDCDLFTDDVKVVISSAPPAAPNAGANQTLCAGTISLSGSAIPATALAQWTMISAAPSAPAVVFSDPSIASPQVTGLLPNTTYTFRYAFTNGCGSSADTVVITTGASTTPVKPVVSFTASGDCSSVILSFPASGVVRTINHTAPSAGQTGGWTVIARPASALTGYSVSASSATVDNISINLSGEAYVSYIYCLTDNNCTAQSVCDTATLLYRTASNNIDAGPDQQLCNITSYPATITLTGSNTTLDKQWTLISSSNGKPVTINSPGSGSTTVSIPGSGTYRFQYAYLGTDPACAPRTDLVEVNASTAGSFAQAGADTSFCNTTGTANLHATPLATGTGQWQIVSVLSGAMPSISNISAPASPITFAQSGSVVLRWSSFGSNAACGPSSSDQVTVTYVSPANAGADFSLCNRTSTNLSAVKAAPSGGSWSQISGPNTAVIASAANPNTLISGLVSGTYTFRWTVPAACVISDDVNVTISNIAATANAGPDFTTCTGSTNNGIPLNAAPAAVGLTGSWIITSFPQGATAGTFSNPGDAKAIYSGATVPGTYIFSWTLSDGNCTSTDYVTATVDPSTCTTITGTVFDDANGNTVINTGENGTTAGANLYVYLVNANNVIVDSAKVKPDGTYTLDAAQSANYTIELSAVQYPIGNNVTTIPIVNTPPAGWATTGENNAGNTGNGDGTSNGELPVSLGTVPFTNANFGLDRLPVADLKNTTIPQPALNQVLVLNGAGGNPPAVSGSDAEDGTYKGGTGTINNPAAVVITSLPTKGELWYNGSRIAVANTVIPGFNPALLEMHFTGSGYTGTTFAYAYQDVAGLQGTANTYTLNWFTPLPLRLLSFSGTTSMCDVVLKWEVAEAADLDRFDIQHSIDGNLYHKIGEVKAIPSSGVEKYSYKYEHAIGTGYYRLCMVEKAGNYSYSPVQVLKDNCDEAAYYIVPNPADYFITVNGGGATQLQIVLLNGIGQVVKELDLAPNRTVNIADLATGLYIVQVKAAGKIVLSTRLVKM